MKLYKLIDEYQEYGYLHNTFGYTESASTPLTYKSISPWGDSSGSGFGASISSFTDGEYFRIDDYGWRNLNDLAWELGVYPSTAGTSVLVRNGELSNVASLVLDGQEYLLLEKDLDPGWITPDVAEARGWGTPTYIVVDEDSGRIVWGGQSALEYGHIYPVALEEPEMAYGVIRPCVIEEPEMVYGAGEYVPPVSNYIDVIVGFRWDYVNQTWQSINFDYNPPDDNYWWLCIKDADDKARIESFGLTTANAAYLGNNGGIVWTNNYTFTCLAVYSDMGQTEVSGYDLTTLQPYSKSGSGLSSNVVAIRNLQKDATYLKSWKCRITRNS